MRGNRPGLRRARASISSSAACSTTRSSSGAASSAARRTRKARSPPTDYGRDHHPRCFTIWLAGGGIKPGITYGRTDDYGYNIADADGNPISPTKDEFTPGAVHVHDLQATILHLLGVDHTQLTFKYQGRHYRLTDVHGHVVETISWRT